MRAAGPSPHRFHIPVMGTGFMIDAALRIAKYGISSALSLVDDVLIEQMRKYHCQKAGETYEEISGREEDSRACRITAYLDLLDRLVGRQMIALRASPFEPSSEITRYYELLPEGPLADEYRAMLATVDPHERDRRQDRLRELAVPGSIDVNIMSKGDRDAYRDGQKLPPRFSDASAALRGFARSTLCSSIIFSAGLNPRLYSYAAEFPDFFPDEQGRMKKHIVLKVSDFHSAAVQGKFLAKRGLWVSEYRVESGLNCGGHAFATQGLLLGPILEEFRQHKGELVERLHSTYVKALREHGRDSGEGPPPVRVTAQGGIGTAEEDLLLREYYGVDGTGWATPFLLVPEVTNLDDDHRRKLCAASDADVYLSDSSPFGLPFWNLRDSASEEARRRRIAEGQPGSRCTKGYVKLFNTEFTDIPICTASREYQKLKLEQLERQELPAEQRDAVREAVLAKSCICHDLGGGATLINGIDLAATPAVCCGPNIVNFSRLATLEEMVGHIYGRNSLLAPTSRAEIGAGEDARDRPHMFVREIELYIDYLREQIAKQRVGLSSITPNYVREFKQNLRAGIGHYRRIAEHLSAARRSAFLHGLTEQEQAMESMRETACAASDAQ
jgi:hypothetical protein